MKLDENLFDDVVPMDIPVVELEQPIEIAEEDIAPETPEVGPEMGMANLIATLIKDEYDAIEGYNSFIATFSENNEHPEMFDVIKHIASEEQKHVGELTELLKIVSPNAEKQEEGKEEAKQELGAEEVEAAVIEIVEPTIGADVWEALKNINDETVLTEAASEVTTDENN